MSELLRRTTPESAAPEEQPRVSRRVNLGLGLPLLFNLLDIPVYAERTGAKIGPVPEPVIAAVVVTIIGVAAGLVAEGRLNRSTPTQND